MVIRPRAELEGAVLLVEGKMLDLNLAGAFVDGWRKPVDAAIGKDNGVGEECYFIGTISTIRKGRKRENTLESMQINLCEGGEVASCSDAYLLYRTISGSQMCLEGIRSLSIPSYFAGSHDNL